MLEKVLTHPFVQRLVKIDTITSLVGWAYWLPTTVFGGGAVMALIAAIEHKIGVSGFVLASIVFSCAIMTYVILYIKAAEAWRTRKNKNKDFMVRLDAAIQSIGSMSDEPSKFLLQLGADGKIDIFGSEIVGTITGGLKSGELDFLVFSKINQTILLNSKIEFDEADSIENKIYGRARICDINSGKKYGKLEVNMTELSHLLGSILSLDVPYR